MTLRKTIGVPGIMLTAAIAFSFCLLLECTQNLAGGSSEIGNGLVVGRIVSANGFPASNTSVALMPADYNPQTDSRSGTIVFDTTTSLGEYRFTGLEKGSYTIQAIHLDDRTRLLRTISITDDTLSGLTDTLHVPGAIKVMFPDSADIVNGYAYIPGTTIIGFYNATIGGVVLDSVPAGIISSVNYAVKNSSTEYVMRNGITVSSHDTVLVANIAWRYAKQLSLNTTATGADVSGNVYGFPVLVRLNSGNFNFSQAQANGQDIRFAKEDNTSLPYEIERWDSANALAEVWVRVDSVYGHDSMQVIMMYWGNVNAADSSNGSRVFDTANGFQGIWHMAQAGGDTVKDATVNRFNGVPVGMTSGSAVDGMIGKAQGFNGLSQYIAIPGTANSVLDFAKDGIYSISAWAYVDTLDSFFHTVFSKGKYDYTLQIYTSNEWEISEFKDLVGWEARRSSATACVWVYITGIRFGAQAYLYVNGALADSATLYPEVSARNTALDASIGKIPDNSSRYFKGKIDEVRVASVAYGADWIKLCYMNQKSVDALIVDKK